MWAHECPWYSCNGLNQCSICSGPLSNLLQCQAAAGERCLPQCPFSLPVTPPQQSCSPGWSGKANSIRKVPTLDHGGSKTSSNKPSRGLHHAYHTFFIFLPCTCTVWFFFCAVQGIARSLSMGKCQDMSRCWCMSSLALNCPYSWSTFLGQRSSDKHRQTFRQRSPQEINPNHTESHHVTHL